MLQAELRCQVEVLSARLTAHEAAEVSAGAGVATQQELQVGGTCFTLDPVRVAPWQ